MKAVPEAASGEGLAMAGSAVGSPAAVRWGMEVWQSLAVLDRVDCAALRLIYWHGMTQAQVARELSLPESVVRRCVARGMRELAGHPPGSAYQHPPG